MERRSIVSLTAAVCIGLITTSILLVKNGVSKVEAPRDGDLRRFRRESPATPADIDDIYNFISENVQPENIRSNLRYLTRKPHMGGTPAEWKTADWTVDMWRSQGLDQVHKVPYTVILSYPHDTVPNKVHLLSSSGEIVWTSAPKQKPLYAAEESAEQVPFTFNAYSAKGNASGGLVFVNYGAEEDWQYLETRGISVQDKIVIAKYGKIFRGNIAKSAEDRGALGLILYGDPKDYAPRGTDFVYPKSLMLPPSGAPLGTCTVKDGDPSTPFYPSVESAFRLPEEEWPVAKILIQPVGYEDAYVLMSKLGGPEVPEDWRGGFNLTYHLGPEMLDDHLVKMDIMTTANKTTIYNVVGIIKGSIEPDRYVVLGNHRDAWIFGSSDPSSGSASMMEVSRVIMQYVNETDWRPRRTLVFISWGAEEFGLVGSTEFTEQFEKQLSDRTIAYLNQDMSLEGNYTMRAKAVPLLQDILFETAKKVANPDPEEVAAGRTTVFDTWALRKPHPDIPNLPEVSMLGSGSDYASFQHTLGIPSLDIRYTHDDETIEQPLYHTLYETFAFVDEILDKDFLFQKSMAVLWGNLAVRLSESEIIPFSLMTYVRFIERAQLDFVKNYGSIISNENITLDFFMDAVKKFGEKADAFLEELENIDTDNLLELRRVNDQMMMVERAFTDCRGLPGRPEYRHVVASPSIQDSYSGTAFAGLADTLAAIKKSKDQDEKKALWRQFQEHLAAVTHLTQTAAKVLTNDLW